jgi:hypothetical protein
MPGTQTTNGTMLRPFLIVHAEGVPAAFSSSKPGDRMDEARPTMRVAIEVSGLSITDGLQHSEVPAGRLIDERFLS